MSEEVTAKPPETSDRLQPEELRLLLRNLAGLVGTGVVASAWILYYTDWFEAIGGLLTLTGIFAWVAFLVELVSDERKGQIQSAFERRVLLNRSSWRWLLGSAGVLLVLTVLTGTIEVRSFSDDSTRSLTVTSAGAASDARPLREAALTPFSSRKLLFFGWGRLRVKLSGLPALEVRAGLFRPRVLSSPDDFTRSPVLLIRPSTGLSHLAAGSDSLVLVIRRGGETLVGPLPFRGRAVWVGCDRDVAIPAWLYRRWEPEEPVPWLPAVDTESLVSLRAGDELSIRLETASGEYAPEIRHVVRAPYGSQDFVQEIVLELPSG